MTFAEFQGSLDTLRGLPFPPPSLQTHWVGLQDVPLDLLQAACREAARRCERFPAPAELRQFVNELPRLLPPEPTRTVPLETPQHLGALPTGQPIVQTAVFTPWCRTCGDTGWEPTVIYRAARGMPVPEGAPAVQRCGCWYENPVLIRQREQQARYAASRETKGRDR